MRRGLLIFLALIACLATAAWPDATGMKAKFPLFVVDNDMAPLTGKWVYAAEWSTRPGTKVGGSAIEEGNGQYYFKIGTCDSCVPAGTYDIWVDNSLDSTYAGLFVGYGDEPTANSISSTHVIDGSLLLNADFDGTYGTSSTQLGTVFDVAGQTKIESTEDDDMVKWSITNYGSGRNKTTRQSVLEISHTANDLNDSTGASGGILIDIDTHPTLDVPTRSLGTPFGIKYTARHHYKGIGMDVKIYNSDWSDNWGRHSDFAGYYGYVTIDSCTKWWAPGTNDAGTPVIFEGRMGVRRVADARGAHIDIAADSSVAWIFGYSAQIDGTTSSSFGKKAYGLYSYVLGAREVYGHKSYSVGKGAGADVYGSFVSAAQDTAFGMGGTVHGYYASCLHRIAGENQGHKRAWGIEAIAGGDSAYGGQFKAYSDVDENDNFARGVEGYAEGGAKNIGVLGHAAEVGGTTNIGVFGYARDNDYNYGGRFYATSPTGDRNYGVWARGDSGAVLSWAGYFEGQVAADSTRLPATASVPDGYLTREAIEVEDHYGLGSYINLGATDDAIGIWVQGGGASDGQYGVWIGGFNAAEYALTVASGIASFDVVDVSGLLLATGGTRTVLYLPENVISRMCGVATVPDGVDTVRVTNLSLSAADKDDLAIAITALGGTPEGGTPYVARVTGGAFTIYCTTNQTGDQEFYWMAIGRY